MTLKTISQFSTMSSEELTKYLDMLLKEKTEVSYLHNNITICIDRTLFAQRELTNKATK